MFSLIASRSRLFEMIRFSFRLRLALLKLLAAVLWLKGGGGVLPLASFTRNVNMEK